MAGGHAGSPGDVAGRIGARGGPARGRWLTWPRWRPLRWIGLALVLLVAALVVATALVDEPLRRRSEARMNAALEGYTVTIGELDVQPLSLALILEDVTVVQDSDPSPPVLYVPRWETSIEWRALLSGAVVGDTELVGPRVFVTLLQAQREARDERPVTERGWQDAVTSIYPLEINSFRVVGGELTYWDGGDLPPVELDDIDLETRDIRNVRSREGELPSPIFLRATLFGEGRLRVDGAADLLAEPSPAVRADVSLEDVELAPLAPVAQHWAVVLDGGTVSAAANVELGPSRRRILVERVELEGVRLDYVKRSEADEQRLDRVKRAATDAESRPAVEVDLQEATLSGATLGYVDRTADPDYRVFFSEVRATAQGLSNRESKRRGQAHVEGLFMDSGRTVIEASFATGAAKPELEVDVRIEDVDLTRLNDVLLANGGFDVNRGRLSFYSHVAVREGRVEGYAKPLFAGLDVYDIEQDSEKNVLRQAWEAVVGATGKVLENTPRDEVATVADLSGPIESPETSTLQIVLNLVRNAFFQAILPGLERERSG